MAWARSACGPGCGKRLERAMASPAAVSSLLRVRNIPITVFANRVTGLPCCWVAFISIAFSVLGRPLAGRPVSLGLRPIMPARYCLLFELRLRDPPNGCEKVSSSRHRRLIGVIQPTPPWNTLPPAIQPAIPGIPVRNRKGDPSNTGTDSRPEDAAAGPDLAGRSPNTSPPAACSRTTKCHVGPINDALPARRRAWDSNPR